MQGTSSHRPLHSPPPISLILNTEAAVFMGDLVMLSAEGPGRSARLRPGANPDCWAAGWDLLLGRAWRKAKGTQDPLQSTSLLRAQGLSLQSKRQDRWQEGWTGQTGGHRGQ